MRLETPLVAIILGSLFFIGFFTIFMSIADEYDTNYDLTVLNTQNNETTVYEAFNRLNSTKTEMDNVNQDFEDTLINQEESLFPFFSLALKIGKSIYHSLTSFKDIMQIGAEILGIPSDFIIAFFAIITTVFVLLIIFVLLGRST